jgi:Tol biopolymer transport system component
MCTPFTEDALGAAASDGATLDGPPCDPSKPFGAPRLVEGLADIGASAVSGLRLSRDSLTGYFSARDRPDGNGGDTLYIATRSSPASPFANVTPIAGSGLDGVGDRLDPSVSADSLVLVFAMDQSVGEPLHLYEATRATVAIPFGAVFPAPGVNDPKGHDDTSPFLVEDKSALYFASTRVTTMQSDIYMATWNGKTFDEPVSQANLNSPFSEVGPVVTPDQLTIYYASELGGSGAAGELNIWTATRESVGQPFPPGLLVRELTSPDFNVPTFVTRDLCNLYFASTRGGTLAQYVASRSP